MRPVVAEAERLQALFASRGAVEVFADILQPAETLLDLYGEDIRARAYVTTDAQRGEMMLRPDFTVPVVQAHMQGGATPARYHYRGTVFRKQERDRTRPSEYEQVGFELFGGDSQASADAEVFAIMLRSLEGVRTRAVTGDIGILMDAVEGLKTNDRRKAALMRHIWRPDRFRVLLDRFGGQGPVPESRSALLAMNDPMAAVGDEIGLRSKEEIRARIDALLAEAHEPPISAEERAILDEIMRLRTSLPNAADGLRAFCAAMPALSKAADRLEARTDALRDAGVNVEALEFEGNFGRTNLEYYDGFVFGIYAAEAPGLGTLATGGRYDALTRVLGKGRTIPAVGGVVRPEIVARVRGKTLWF